MDAFVTIKTFTYAHEVGIIPSLLEAEGIKTFLKDEHLVTMDPLRSNAYGGIKLQVPLSEAQRAVHLLLEQGYLTEADIAVREKEADQAMYTITVSKKYEAVYKVLLLLFMGAVIVTVYYFFSH